jgi:argininosuccinate synthase
MGLARAGAIPKRERNRTAAATADKRRLTTTSVLPPEITPRGASSFRVTGVAPGSARKPFSTCEPSLYIGRAPGLPALAQPTWTSRMKKGDVKKVVLAYSGGLDTSIILKWLQTNYGCEVVTFTADLGQGEELTPAREKALLLGIKPENIFIEDLREEFVRDYVFPMFRANTVYEGQYLLGTSIARPLIAKKQIEIAEKVGADAVAHGATGKGNDQVRFELSYYALKPDVTVIAPWREWDLTSRTRLIEFAEAHQIPIAKDKRGDAPFSVDANLLHASSEGKVLEDPAQEVPDYVYSRTDDPLTAPDKPAYIDVDFEKGDAVAIDGRKLSPAMLLTFLNALGRTHGIGRLDLVENRFVGMKSRGMYETPGGTILLAAHRGIEQITLDRGAAHLKDELMPKYAELIYNGFWFTPEREMLQAAIDKSQQYVTGRVRLKLYRGSVAVVGRSSDYSLYDQELVTFEEGAVAYDHRDAEGFIKLNALRLRTLGQRKKKLKL